jgi:mannose-6-phosphate isomerase-like protein (cupin superfamily)
MASSSSSSSAGGGGGELTRHVSEADTSPCGAKALVQGDKVALRLWDLPASEAAASGGEEGKRSDLCAHHESVCYCLAGRGELSIEGQRLTLAPGQSWLVPAGARHSYRVIEGPFKALEATGGPATK